MLTLNGEEIMERSVEFGILNTVTGDVLDVADQETAEFDALLYPNAVPVARQVFRTRWVAFAIPS